MDTNNNQEEYESLENVEEINERVLNTPAEEQKIDIPTIDDGQKLDTFMQFNKLPEVRTGEGIVLDLAGEKAEINEGEITKESSLNLFGKITGNELQAESLTSPGAFFTILLISAALFGFLLMSFKRTEEMSKLQKEINKLKDKTNKIV